MYTSHVTGAIETIPIGATQVVVQGAGASGSGGAGAGSGCIIAASGGGRAGGYFKKTIALTSANWGQTMSYNVGTGGAASSDPGTASSASGSRSLEPARTTSRVPSRSVERTYAVQGGVQQQRARLHDGIVADAYPTFGGRATGPASSGAVLFRPERDASA
jgi:hypothetical protein